MINDIMKIERIISLLAFIIGIPFLIYWIYFLGVLLYNQGSMLNIVSLFMTISANLVGVILIISGYLLYRIKSED